MLVAIAALQLLAPAAAAEPAKLSDVERLSIERDCEALSNAYAHFIDFENPDGFAALFAEDAEWRGISHGHLWWKRTPS